MKRPEDASPRRHASTAVVISIAILVAAVLISASIFVAAKMSFTPRMACLQGGGTPGKAGCQHGP